MINTNSRCGGVAMGRFVNPDNSAFQVALNSEIYVDKTGLLENLNKKLDTMQGYICNSRPRRFGKSLTANMLTAYYSRGCDSEEMFSNLTIGKTDDFSKHLNKYDVIHLDIQWFLSNAKNAGSVVSYITRNVLDELRRAYPDTPLSEAVTLPEALSRIREESGRKFIVIIDEWDVLIREEAANKKVQEEYINFLRGMFKGAEPTKYIRLVYLTGILPIKRLKTQSALNNFDEFTMIDAGMLASYIGFTEDEVQSLCAKYGRDFEQAKRWYDGYVLDGYQVYNPIAVVKFVTEGGRMKSYWSATGTYEAIVPLISMNFDGLKTAVIEMLSGACVKVQVQFFQNDPANFANKDDVLTYLIHLGYLGYDQHRQTAFIPNEEIRQELTIAVESTKWSEWFALGRESAALLNSTLSMDAEAVAEGIEKIHTEYVPAIQYNNENSLSSVLTIAYLSAIQYYFKPVRELPAGRGFADFVFIPKTEYLGEYPALVIELKWNGNAQTAIRQIKDRKYPASIMRYTGNILLIGISYDKKTKEHRCIIEEFFVS